MIFWTIMVTVGAGVGGLIVYLYFLKRGQFEEPEDVKYQLFREDK